MVKVGARVIAISHIEKGKVFSFGEGVYEGDEVPEGDNLVGFLPMLRDEGVTNPVILLDTGKRVYGCECWWGSMEEVKEKLYLEDVEIILVDIDEKRAEMAARTEEAS